MLIGDTHFGKGHAVMVDNLVSPAHSLSPSKGDFIVCYVGSRSERANAMTVDGCGKARSANVNRAPPDRYCKR